MTEERHNQATQNRKTAERLEKAGKPAKSTGHALTLTKILFESTIPCLPERERKEIETQLLDNYVRFLELIAFQIDRLNKEFTEL